MVGAGEGEGFVGLEDEHRELRQLFGELASTTAAVARKDLILRLMGALAAHDDVEASAIGPVIRERLVDGHRRSRSLRRHYREIDRLLVEVERRSVFSPDMPQLLSATSRELEALIEEQESVFHILEHNLGPDQLAALGAKVARAQHRATTRPHPFLPRRSRLARRLRAGMARVDRLRNHFVTRL